MDTSLHTPDSSQPRSETAEENGGSTLIAQRKPEGLLLSRLSENGADSAALLAPTSSMPVSSPLASTVSGSASNGNGNTKPVAVLTKIHQQLEAEASREIRDVAAQDLAATLEAVRACVEALNAIETRTRNAGAEQAAWLRDELRAIESLLNAK